MEKSLDDLLVSRHRIVLSNDVKYDKYDTISDKFSNKILLLINSLSSEVWKFYWEKKIKTFTTERF